MTRTVRRACPTEGADHAAILAPSRPRLDDVRRFCLECSRATGKLVPSFVYYLASTLLSATRLNQARELLMTAKEEGLDLDRLLGLLGVT